MKTFGHKTEHLCSWICVVKVFFGNTIWTFGPYIVKFFRVRHPMFASFLISQEYFSGLKPNFAHIISGEHHGPSYTHSRHCSLDNQCITSIGEICWWFYDGCIHGQCMCDPRSHFMDASGKCRRGKNVLLFEFYWNCFHTRLLNFGLFDSHITQKCKVRRRLQVNNGNSTKHSHF